MLINRELAIFLLYGIIGTVFGLGSLQYELGTLEDMHTGYFPALISGILILLGAINYIKNFNQSEKVMINIKIPFLLITIIVVTFVITLMSGMLLAIIFLLWSSAYLHPDFNIKSTAITTVICIAMILVLKYTILKALPLW